MNETYLGIENYYGEPYVYKKNGKYFIAIESHSSADSFEISKEFYNACIYEFKYKQKEMYKKFGWEHLL